MVGLTLEAEGPPTRVRMTTFLATAWRRVILEPVRDGRLRDIDWPPGLRVIVIIGYVALVLASALALLSTPLRLLLPLAPVTDEITIPRAVVGVLLLLAAVVLTSFLLACCHGPVWLLLTGLLVGVPALLVMTLVVLLSSIGAPYAAIPALAAILTIAVLMLVWRRRGLGPWQFPVLFALVLTVAVVVAADASIRAVPLGYDVLPGQVGLLIGVLAPLAAPLTFAAGTAPAEVTVTLASRTSSLLGRTFRRSVTYTVMLAGAFLVIGQLVWQVLTGRYDALTGSSVITTVSVLVGCSVGVAAMVRMGRGRWRTDGVADTGGALGWPAGAVLLGAIVPLLAVLIVLMMLSAVVPSLDWSFTLLQRTWPVPATRLAASVVALILAIWSARRGQPVRAAILVCATAALLPMVLNGLLDTDRALVIDLDLAGLLLTLFLLGWMTWLAARRQLTEPRAVGLLAITVVLVIMPHRQAFGEPLEFLFGPGVLIILFGLWWQLFTSSEVGNRDSRRFPRTSRVLLLLTSVLLTVLVLAYNSLTRQPAAGGMQAMAELGDSVLGFGILGAAVAGTAIDVLRDRLPA